MAGTLKKGAPSRANTTHVLTFLRPAGRTIKLKTAKDVETSGEASESHMHGDGAMAPYAIARADGKPSYKLSVAQHEWREIVAICSAGGVPMLGSEGPIFDYTQTTTIDGVPKMTTKVVGAGIGKMADKISADGNMVDFEGLCLNIYKDGVPMFKEAT